ncbi:unnamed protein product [Diplocarpon coronariae]
MADSMLCREDEMVVGIDSFLDPTTHWSKPGSSSEQSQASTAGYSPSRALSTSNECNSDSDCDVSTISAQQSHIGRFYNYKHAGCNHPYCAEESANVAGGLQLWESAKNVRSSAEPSTVYVISPRWCNYDVYMRKDHINTIARSQCITIASSAKADDVKGVLEQYALGVAAGRVEALTLPLEECEGICGPAEERLVDLLKGFGLSIALREGEELAEMMDRMVLDVDQLGQDFAQVFREVDAFESGVGHGRAYQARREREAFNAGTVEEFERLLRRDW